MTTKRNVSLGTAEVVWNLTDLYEGSDDPMLQADCDRCLAQAGALASAHRDRVAALAAPALHDLVRGLEEVDILVAKLATFAFLNFITRIDDDEASALLQKIETLSAEVGRETVFFQLEWNRIDEAAARQRIESQALAEYGHYLAALRRFAPHQLGRQEEELLQDLAPVRRNAWTVLFEKVMGNIRFGPDGRTEEEVLSDLYHPERPQRQAAAAELTEGLRQNLHILTHIFNTLAADKMIEDRFRRHRTWLSTMNLDNELDEATVETLVAAVTSRYDQVHRYYRFKRELLEVDELFDYDRYAPIPGLDNGVISWDRCREMVLGAFADFSQQMAEIAEKFFLEKWIHAPVQQAKRGGAFAHPCVPGIHPYIMVNYSGNVRDVSTVAHELGHGVHQYLAAGQGFYNADTPLVMAETASVFAELLVFKAQLGLLTEPAAKRAFICQKLESIFATVFRQVAMNRFEERMHNGRRDLGELSSAQLSAFWLETQEAMFGGAVHLSEGYASWWAYIPHFLGTPGYVYSYAFGELLVLALYARYQEEGAQFVERYLALLAAGGSSSPYDLVRSFSIDLNDSGFWHGGLTVIEEMLSEIGA